MKKIAVYLLVLSSFVACSKGTTTQQTEEEKAEVVQTIILQPRLVQRNLQVSSNLLGYQTLNVAPSITGKIEHIFVEVGDRKEEGDMLVRITQTQFRTAKLTMENLAVEKQRMDELIKDGSVSQQAYDQLKLSYDQAAENLNFLELNTFYRAPFAGVVSARNYDDGETYLGQQSILVYTQVNKLKTIIAIPERYYPRIKNGMALTLKTEVYPERTFRGFIEVVYPTIDATTHTFQCKVQIPNGDNALKPGMYVTTSLNLGDEKTIVVPYQSVEKLIGSNDRYVFLNEDGRAKRVTVTLGERYDEDVEIFAPEIKEGAEYVVYGQRKLVDGKKIEVANNQTL